MHPKIFEPEKKAEERNNMHRPTRPPPVAAKKHGKENDQQVAPNHDPNHRPT